MFGKIESIFSIPITKTHFNGAIYLQSCDGVTFYWLDHIGDVKLIIKNIGPLIETLVKQKFSAKKDQTQYLRNEYNISGIIGNSVALRDVLNIGLKVAPLDINILLTGESGTGKTQLAEIIHQNSLRKDNPFVPLNCAALPDGLIENELFGSVEGGHSAANKTILGKVAMANGGTLLLDEIGELSINIQAKLLQFLQSGQYYPLGSSKLVTADVRVVTATNLNLEEAILRGTFREDLFYRINVFSIHMPSLSQRETDIYELADFFCNQSCKKYKLQEINLHHSALKSLLDMPWKGNIRELKNVIESTVIYASLEGKKEISFQDILARCTISSYSTDYKSTYKDATSQFQRKFLKQNLDAWNWNVSKTARELSMSRSQLNKLITTLRLKSQTP